MTTTHRVNDLTIHKIVELEFPFMPALEMLPGLTEDELAVSQSWLPDSSITADGTFILAFQSYIVQTPKHTILVDSGIGTNKQRPRPQLHMRSDETFLHQLTEIGLSTDDIDFVVCTHLHHDHVGWNTRLVDGQWVPTFANARYLIVEKELAFTRLIHAERGQPAYLDSVQPVIDAGMAELVPDDFCLDGVFRMSPTPGHTAGHVVIGFGSDYNEVVVLGDLLHVPLQVRRPELSFARDYDPQLAAVSRRAVLERYCGTETVLCMGHFPGTSVGRVEQTDDGFIFRT